MTEIENIIEETLDKWFVGGSIKTATKEIATALSDKVVEKSEVVKVIKKIAIENDILFDGYHGLFDRHLLDLLDLFELEGK